MLKSGKIAGIYVFLLTALLFGAVAVCVPFVHAQTGPALDMDRPRASLELNPTNPQPGQMVTATLKQYVFDSEFSLITWKNNGEVVLQGYGEDTYQFTAGPVGSLLTLEAVAADQEGRNVTARKSTRISDISFVWEAQTYTPPFFMGRPKFTYGAPVSIVAYPLVFNMEGELYDASELTFSWMQGMQKVTTGRGLNHFVAKPNTPFDALEVTVRVSEPDGIERMTHNVTLKPRPSSLFFYEDDPLLGVLYQRTVPDSFTLSKEELKLVAEPLYSAVKNRTDPTLSYTWTVNNVEYGFPGSIVLRPEGGISGTTDVSLIVLNSNNYLGRLQKRVSVQYSSEGTTGTPWTDTETNPL